MSWTDTCTAWGAKIYDTATRLYHTRHIDKFLDGQVKHKYAQLRNGQGCSACRSLGLCQERSANVSCSGNPDGYCVSHAPDSSRIPRYNLALRVDTIWKYTGFRALKIKPHRLWCRVSWFGSWYRTALSANKTSRKNRQSIDQVEWIVPFNSLCHWPSVRQLQNFWQSNAQREQQMLGFE